MEVFVDDVSDIGLMTLTGTMKSATTETHSETYGTWNQLPSVLIVDDDAGQNYQTYLANALVAAGYPGRVYDANTLGRPRPRSCSTPTGWFSGLLRVVMLRT